MEYKGLNITWIDKKYRRQRPGFYVEPDAWGTKMYSCDFHWFHIWWSYLMMRGDG